MNVTNAEQALKSYCKTKGYEKPIYTIVSRDSTRLEDDTFRFKHYVCAVKVNGQFLANGDGFSKRIARKKAAMCGLQNLRIIEMSQLFQMFKTHMPMPQLQYSGEGHQKSILSLFQPSVQIEEIASIENGRNQLIPSAPVPSTSIVENDQKQLQQQQQQQSGSDNEQTIRRNSDPSEELILAAIAKLRSISFKSPEEEEEAKKEDDEDEDENLADKHRKQMKEISEEITHLNLADQTYPKRGAIQKDPEKQGIESILYIEDHANVPEQSFRKFRKPPPPVPKRKYFGLSKPNSKQIFKI